MPQHLAAGILEAPLGRVGALATLLTFAVAAEALLQFLLSHAIVPSNSSHELRMRSLQARLKLLDDPVEPFFHHITKRPDRFKILKPAY